MTDARNSTPTEDRIEVRLTDPLAREFCSCLEFAGAVIRSALLEHGQRPLMLITHRDTLLASVTGERVSLHVSVGTAPPKPNFGFRSHDA